MNETEMITTTGYTALRDFNLADAMRDELNGMDITFDRCHEDFTFLFALDFFRLNIRVEPSDRLLHHARRLDHLR